LGGSAAKFVAKNLEEIIRRPEFDNIGEQHWLMIWPEKSRPEEVEEELFEKFVHWTKQDPKPRSATFDKMSKHVKYSSMELEELVKFSWSDTVRNSRACQELMEKAKDLRLMDQYELITQLRSELSE